MKILVIKLSSMGDVLHALPTAAELKRQTGAELHWAVHPAFAKLVHCFSCVDRTIEIPRHGNLADHRRAINILRETHYDLVVDLQGLLKSAIVARLARASRRVGPSFHREGSRLFYNAVPKLILPRRHAVDECLDTLAVLGLQRPEAPAFPLEAPEVDPGQGEIHVAIAPLSRWKTKNWPLESFAEAARILYEERGATTHILGGGAESSVAEELMRLAGVPMRNHCGEYDLPHSLGLLARVGCLLTNDSGPMHLAAAVGTPCVAIFGPTDPIRTGPYGSKHLVLQSKVCPPCHKRECARKDHACMKAVTPLQAARAVMDRVQDPGQ